MKKIFTALAIIALTIFSVWSFKSGKDRVPSSTNIIDETGSVIVDALESPLSGDTKKQIKKAILASWDWHFKAQTLYINFENLKIRSDSGTREICELYPEILLVVVAPDLSYSGEHPEIKLSIPCHAIDARFISTAFDFNFLLVAENIQKIKQTSNDLAARIRILNWDSEVPSRWRVKRLLFLPANKDIRDQIDLVQYEILNRLGYSVEFEVPIGKQ
jgi:hypothetical protein